MHKPGVERFDMSLPTPSASSIKILALSVAKRNINLSHFDIQKASVQVPLEEVYMNHSTGCGDLIDRLQLTRPKSSFHGPKTGLAIVS